MAGHCEALTMGKQQKMSVFTSAQQNHDILFGGPLEELYEEKKSSFSNTNQSEKVSPQISGKIMMLNGLSYYALLHLYFIAW